jgi:hypothetical protein
MMAVRVEDKLPDDHCYVDHDEKCECVWHYCKVIMIMISCTDGVLKT